MVYSKADILRIYAKDMSKQKHDFYRASPLLHPPESITNYFTHKALNRDEGGLIYSRIPVLGSGLYANLGCFRGATASLFATGLNEFSLEGKVYTVDLYNDAKAEGVVRVWGEEDTSRKAFKDLGLSDRIEVCKGFTSDWGKKLKDKRFRLIFIDADHSYIHCKNDFNVWSPLLEDDGELIFHDTHVLGVDRVIEEMEDDWKMTHHVISTKIFRRKN